MKVYFDNNVLIDYEEGKITVPNRIDIDYYYSYVHLEELIESGDKFESLMNKRLDSIVKLTQCNYIQNNENDSLESIINSPFDALKKCLSVKSNTLNEACHDFGKGLDRDKLINDLGIKVRKLNNYTADDIIMTYGRDLLLYLRSTASNNQEEFQSMFNFLDLIGYWSDKLTERSNMARSYDANHAYFALYCDYFVTNDKRTMSKANMTYQLMEVNTIALSYKDFVTQFMVK